MAAESRDVGSGRVVVTTNEAVAEADVPWRLAAMADVALYHGRRARHMRCAMLSSAMACRAGPASASSAAADKAVPPMPTRLWPRHGRRFRRVGLIMSSADLCIVDDYNLRFVD